MAKALLLSWDLRIEIIVPLVLLGWLYLRGWRRLRTITAGRAGPARSNSHPPLAASWKPASYIAGLLVVAISLMSPIDVLGGQLFFMHMIQHLLLVMIAPPLLWIATPFAMIMWGLPRKPRQQVAAVLTQESRFRWFSTTVTQPGVVWFAYVIVYVGWHDPGMYNLALRNEFVHDLEHLTFFLTAMAFWWHLTGVAPRFHPAFSTAKRLLYVIVFIPINMFTGVAIAFATEPIYTYYTAVPRFYGLSVLDDQIISGVIMWIPGSMMLLGAALILISRIVQVEADKPSDPNAPWLVDEAAVLKHG